MKMPDYIKRAMDAFPGSFINHNNELILVPKFNVYFSLNDVNSEEDMQCKFCEWVSRDCCCALRYKQFKRLNEYYETMTGRFNAVCGTGFSVDEMRLIYSKLGNSVNHDLTVKFIRNGFCLPMLS